MGIFKDMLKQMFIKVPSYEGQAVFDKDVASVLEAVKKTMKRCQLIQNVSDPRRVYLAYKDFNPRASGVMQYTLLPQGENSTKVNLSINGIDGNAQATFEEFMRTIEKYLKSV